MNDPIPIFNTLGVSRWKQELLKQQLKQEADKELYNEKMNDLFKSHSQPITNQQPQGYQF
jgi:hypothetical protein